MEGWAADTLVADVLEKAKEVARDLRLELSMKDAFVPGKIRCGFVQIPLVPNECTGVGGRDAPNSPTLQQACQPSRVTKPDANAAKLWLAVSHPPEKCRRAALAGKVKWLIIEVGGNPTPCCLPLHLSAWMCMGDRDGVVPWHHNRACLLNPVPPFATRPAADGWTWRGSRAFLEPHKRSRDSLGTAPGFVAMRR